MYVRHIKLAILNFLGKIWFQIRC